VSSFADRSRDVAFGLAPGDHELTDERLRKVYRIGKITEIGRREIAGSLQEAGLKVLSDPVEAPLIVHKPRLSLAQAPHPEVATPPVWYRHRWVAIASALLALLVIGGLLAPEFRSEPVGVGGGKGVGTGGTGDAEGTGTGSTTPPPGAKADPRNLIPAAEALVAEDAYVQAQALVSGLPVGDRDRIGRAVSRRLAARTRSALRRNDSTTARRLVEEAGRYPVTPEMQVARAAVQEADP
jgi:hypothetical protein